MDEVVQPTGTTGEEQEGSTDASGTGTGTAFSTTDLASSGSSTAECSEAADCDDGVWCNGEELCSDGRCGDGEQPCPSRGPAQCEVTCGQRERCDGADTNCNGHIDVDDGVALNITVLESEYANELDIAYLPGQGVYGLAYANRDFEVMFRSFSVDGVAVSEPVRMSPELASVVLSRGLFLARSGEHFLALYETDAEEGIPVLQTVSAQGQVGPPTPLLSPETFGAGSGLSELDDGQVAAIWRNTASSVAIRRLASDGSTLVEDTVPSPSPVVAPRLASVRDALAMTWSDASSTRLDLFDNRFGLVSTVPISGGAAIPRAEVKPMGDGFAVISRTDSLPPALEYAEYETDGSIRCGPITVLPPTLLSFHHLDVYEDTAVVHVSDSQSQSLIRLRENCEPLGTPNPLEGDMGIIGPGAVDINDSGVAVATSSYDPFAGDVGRVAVRIMGPNLCDAPLSPR